MRKIYLVFLSVIIFILHVNLSAAETNDINELWGEVSRSYLERDYSEYENKKIIGKYYKVGIMGHRIATEIKQISLKAYKLEDFIPSKSVGLAETTKVTSSKSYQVVNEITATLQVKVGTIEEIEAVVNLDDGSSVGANTTLTTEYKFALENTYSESLSKTFTVEDVLNYSTIPSDKKTFSVSRVVCCLEFEIDKTYTEEQNIFGKWNMLSNTEKKDFIIRYYIADVICYCYNDNTFGDTAMGVYPLTVMKEYN